MMKIERRLERKLERLNGTVQPFQCRSVEQWNSLPLHACSEALELSKEEAIEAAFNVQNEP